MKVIEWNISYNARKSEIIKALEEYTKDSFIIMLLEVIPDMHEELLNHFSYIANIEYSLKYRAPGKYDGKNRKLGVLIMTSKDIDIKEVGVYERALYPDRTLLETLTVDGKEIKIAAFHSITGCDNKKSKSTNFLSLTEAIDGFQPDIIGIDANEPAVDHYEIDKMVFFNKNGKGAETFFREIKHQGLKDSYVLHYNQDDYEEGLPLAVSHKIIRKKPVRYDFVFINEDRIKCIDSHYEYEKAISATADHAIVISEVQLL